MVQIANPLLSPTLGIASQDSHQIAATQPAVILSSNPPTVSFDEILAPNQTLAAYTVVGKNAQGQIVPAVLTTTPAIGILPVAVTSGAAPLPGVNVWRQGNFAREVIVFDASYATPAQRQNAFEGAPSPTSIRLGAVRTWTPTT